MYCVTALRLRPILMTPSQTGSNYINAVFVNVSLETQEKTERRLVYASGLMHA